MAVPVAISSGARVAQALGVNSIPVVGLFLGGWSTGTTLALYWVESVVATIFIAIRILVHRRLTRKAGHWSVDITKSSTRASPGRPVRGTSTLLASFLLAMLSFTAAHGLFLGVILFGVLPKLGGPGARLALGDLRRGTQAIAGWLGAGLVYDLVGIRSRPFRWIEGLTQAALSRVLVVHLTIILGMGAVLLTGAPVALFLVFAAFKTLVDLGSVLPSQDVPRDPPRWTRFLDRFQGVKPGETFTQYWRRSVDEERRKQEANEQSRPADPPPS